MDIAPALTQTADSDQIDRVDILKSASIFVGTPREALAGVVDLLDEIQVQEGGVIFEKGDIGTSMYIIVDGSVRVHDGEMILNYLGPRDVFGEMAAIDSAPRSASVTAVKATRLFRLDQTHLHQMITRCPDVAWGIIRVLSRHLRGRVADMRADFDYMQQFARVTAAAVAVEEGIYEPASLNEVAQRTDELGQLARIFQTMVKEVSAREQRLKAEIRTLHIQIDEVKKAHEVSAITESDYFQELMKRAGELRSSRGGKADQSTVP